MCGPALPASRLMKDRIHVGNAAVDAHVDSGWLPGHFKPADDVRHSDDVEIKWGVHPPGDRVVFHGTGHSWEAVEESVVLSIRWPSIPGYAVPEQAQQ